MHQHDVERAAPAWLTDGGTEDEVLGLLKTGKEAEVFIVERRTLDGSRSELLAHKRYRPTKVTHKGELAGARVLARPHLRQRRQVPRGPQVPVQPRPAGRRAHDRPRQEDPRRALARPGARHARDRARRRRHRAVPGGVHRRRAAHAAHRRRRHRRAAAGERPARRRRSCASPTSSSSTDLGALTRTGTVHADLSPYNLLWWRDRLWMIDFPQAVDLLQNPHGFDLLHHDVITMTTWFTRKGVPCDGEALFAELLAEAF